MIEYDFSNTNFNRKERWKLFRMRFYRSMTAEQIGSMCHDLELSGYIARRKTGERNPSGQLVYAGEYFLTDKYYRYCIYRRDRFFYSSKWAAVVSSVVSAIVSAIVSKMIIG